MEKMCDILDDLIKETGLSLREIEKQSSVPSSMLSRYLKGTLPKMDVAIRLANYFDCTLDYLFGLSDIKGNRNCKPINSDVFVERYVKALNESKISNWKFAKENHFGESGLRTWKKDKSIPKTETLLIICRELSISLEYLLGRI